MPDTIDNLINYGGNAALGSGSNASIPVAQKEDFTTVNNALRDVMMLNNEKNVRLYQQKINDRDKLNQLIANNEVSTGTIDPENQKYYDAQQKKVQDAYVNWGGDFNNTDGYRNYQNEVQKLKDVSTAAQVRYADLAKLRAEGAQFTLDRDKNNFKKHYDQQTAKPLFEPVTPYQKLHDYSHDNLVSGVLGSNEGLVDENGATIQQPTATVGKTTTKIVNGKPTTTTTQTTAPVKGATTGGMGVNAQGQLSAFGAPTTKYYDWNGMRKNAQSAFIDGGEGYQNQQQHFNAVQDWLNSPQVDDITKKNFIDSMNNRLQKEYVDQTGGKFGKPPEVKIAVDDNGTKHINMSVPDFAAATVLAGINGNYKVTEQGQFNKDIAKYQVDLAKAKTDSIYKGIMGAAAMKRANAYADLAAKKMQMMKSQEEKDAFSNDLFNRNLTEQKDLVSYGVGDENSKRDIKMNAIPADKSLPLFTFEGGKPVKMIPFGATPIGKDGQPIDPTKDGYDPTKNPAVAYRGGYYKPEYLVDGKPTDLSTLVDQYNDFVGGMKDQYKARKGTKDAEDFNWKGSMSDWLKGKIQRNAITVKIHGQNNQSTDARLTQAALQWISNANQKKFQTAAFDEEGGGAAEQAVPEENTGQ